jgi:hypothetical protein
MTDRHLDIDSDRLGVGAIWHSKVGFWILAQWLGG